MNSTRIVPERSSCMFACRADLIVSTTERPSAGPSCSSCVTRSYTRARLAASSARYPAFELVERHDLPNHPQSIGPCLYQGNSPAEALGSPRSWTDGAASRARPLEPKVVCTRTSGIATGPLNPPNDIGQYLYESSTHCAHGLHDTARRNQRGSATCFNLKHEERVSLRRSEVVQARRV